MYNVVIWSFLVWQHKRRLRRCMEIVASTPGRAGQVTVYSGPWLVSSRWRRRNDAEEDIKNDDSLHGYQHASLGSTCPIVRATAKLISRHGQSSDQYFRIASRHTGTAIILITTPLAGENPSPTHAPCTSSSSSSSRYYVCMRLYLHSRVRSSLRNAPSRTSTLCYVLCVPQYKKKPP